MAYRGGLLRGLSIAQMVFGALMIVFGTSLVISVDHWSAKASFGIWIGVWVIIAGVLGYVGARDDSKPDKCLIGCCLGFSISSCVFAAVMFICYCFAIAEFNRLLNNCSWKSYGSSHNSNPYYSYTTPYYYYTYCSPYKVRYNASVGAGLSGCQLTFAVVEFAVALASSIYCCSAVCNCAPAVSSGSANQRVVYAQPQPMQVYPGGQSGVVFLQPDGTVSNLPYGYVTTGQHPMYIPQQPVVMQPPTSWAVPSASTSPGAVTVSYAGAAMPTHTQQLSVQLPSVEDRPPPYNNTETNNAPPVLTAGASAVPGSEGGSVGKVDV
ncbi:uncharacterized protein [Montipora foliosa]|uniref:uncharacterized protein n=1 Tax=Montipora foliosa TaxID=591990 RepID=UPI0035F1223A